MCSSPCTRARRPNVTHMSGRSTAPFQHTRRYRACRQQKSANHPKIASGHPRASLAAAEATGLASSPAGRGWAASPSRRSPVAGSEEAERDPRSSAQGGMVEGSRVGMTRNQKRVPPTAATSHSRSTYSDINVTDSRPDTPTHSRKAADAPRVHDHSAPSSSAARMPVTIIAGTMTSRVHSATAGVRIRRLQSKSAQHSQFQKHLSKTSMASLSTRNIRARPAPVARGRSVMVWLSLAMMVFALGSMGRPFTS
mmetsp:Transcript_3493/g.6960  ORF Transcript_3493/g.6960 Transcript_3493/m.6960 type:complete len:253 (-) Transcript_3493:693-1451(-)